MSFYTRYNPPPKVGVSCGEGLTKPEFLHESDINSILARATKTGFLVDPLNTQRRKAYFGDFSEVADFTAIQNSLAKASQAFDELPAAIRRRFHNDPGELLEFLQDETNRKEAEKLGLVIEQKLETTVSSTATTLPPAGAGDGTEGS